MYRKMRRLSDKHACTEYLTAIQNLEKHGVFSENSIPQLQDVSDFIKRKVNFIPQPQNVSDYIKRKVTLYTPATGCV